MKRSIFLMVCMMLVAFSLTGQTDSLLTQFNTERLQVNKVA